MLFLVSIAYKIVIAEAIKKKKKRKENENEFDDDNVVVDRDGRIGGNCIVHETSAFVLSKHYTATQLHYTTYVCNLA